MTANKLQIRHDYLNNLERLYAGRVDYSPGSRAREMAIKAADSALAGETKLDGEAWNTALEKSGLSRGTTMRQLASLPASA